MTDKTIAERLEEYLRPEPLGKLLPFPKRHLITDAELTQRRKEALQEIWRRAHQERLERIQRGDTCD